MSKSTHKTNAPTFLHNDNSIQVEYSFSEYTETHYWTNASKVWLDILFVHPDSDEVASVRVAKSNLLLCQPKEVIEAVVHSEVRQFLTLPNMVYDYM